MTYVAMPTVNRISSTGAITNVQIPIFFLHSDVQGIVSEAHAAKIVADICNPTRDPAITVHANVFEYLETIHHEPASA